MEKYAPELCSLSKTLFEVLNGSTVEECFEALCSVEDREPITPANIPQFSDINEVANVAKALCGYGEWLSYEDLGKCLSPLEKKKQGAYTKYGENHGKLAALLDLAVVEFKDVRRGCQSSLFSRLFLDLDEDGQRELLAKLSFRVPVVANAICDAVDGLVSVCDYLVILSESTQKRRLPNTMALVKLIGEFAQPQSKLRSALMNVGR